MEMFGLTMSQAAVMLAFVFLGIIVRKTNIVPDNSGFVISRLLTYIIGPTSILYSFINHCSVENFVNNSELILYGAATIITAILVAYPLSKLFVKNYKESSALSYKRDVYIYALAFGNYGYFGRFLVQSIWGDLAHFYFLMFVITLEILANSWGLYTLIPKNANESKLKNIIRGLTTAPVISAFLGIILGLLGVKAVLPTFVMTILQNGSNCYGPIAMLMAGIVIGGYKIRELFFIKSTYIVSFLRLIVLPAMILLVYKLFGLDSVVLDLGGAGATGAVSLLAFALVSFAAPLGINTILFPAAYGGDPHSGASMVLISTLLATITLPLMYLIFV